MGCVEDVGEFKATARALHESLIMSQCRICGSTTHRLKERPSPLSSSFSGLCPSPAFLRLLLIIGILCCCSTRYFIRRHVHPYPPPEGPDFNVSFTRHPIIAPGLRQAGFHNYGDSETAVISTVYPAQTHPGHVTAVYSALPSYYSQPPPSYDQVMQDTQKK
ncbi:vesicular, overexpressed in cancer, prosurvival protein 1-like [Carassius carassius]|uniref:vesicular, overexpressed in cancer, prosurvival protein 1-like n=1 Tax=Carassius carassius TaxID=217509 RepID=UPI00286862C2|nr:vesicular, overexpressed in cancer, prosurvival protein 1-like [Carassius carassius]